MHKSVVHAQESCACTRILCMHKNLDFVDFEKVEASGLVLPKKCQHGMTLTSFGRSETGLAGRHTESIGLTNRSVLFQMIIHSIPLHPIAVQ